MSEQRPVDAVSAYEATAADYAAEVDESPFNALYERPGVIQLLPDPIGKRVLDVGCGSGPRSAWLVSHGAEVVGFDVSPSMVRAAQTRGAGRQRCPNVPRPIKSSRANVRRAPAGLLT